MIIIEQMHYFYTYTAEFKLVQAIQIKFFHYNCKAKLTNQTQFCNRRTVCFFNLTLRPKLNIIMHSLLRLVYKFSIKSHSLHSLQGVLSPHLIRILEQDLATSQKYTNCLKYMEQTIHQHSPQQAKSRCNLLFSAYTVSDSLLHLRATLSNLIVSGQIQSQYELDQLIKWLTKEIKVNSSVGEKEILLKLANRTKEALEFQKQLATIAGKQSNLNSLCKWFREKYTTIDSRHIFECVSKIIKKDCNGQQTRKDNKFWDKLMGIKPRQLKIQCNPKEVTHQHQKITQGKLRFRFPPEPNGYLHIGHVKAMRINFQSALRTGGTCYLRYDDTNPDKESHQFIDEIERNIKWLGYTPDKITFASDYFEQLQGLAHRLIKEGNAYVCDSPQQEIQNQRKHKLQNPYRFRSKQQSLKIFPNLTGNQTLRLRGIPNSPNPTLRDPIIYRQKQKPHPRTGSKFKIYPTYDFAHCTCDSLEHIDYSLCSLEFEVRRELYYTYLDLLGMWKPVVWEYSRLNIEGNVLSKRKIKQFIESGVVEGWDDPRLLTIKGLITRGYTPSMLTEFIDKVNCSRSGNQNYIQHSLLQQEMKKALLNVAPKTMAVLQPFKATVNNIMPGVAENIRKNNDFRGTLEQTLFIEAHQANLLAQGQTLILKNAGAFKVTSICATEIALEHLGNHNITQLRKQCPKIKILHWIGQSQSIAYTAVLYDKLLTDSGDVNPHSKLEYCSARVPSELIEKKPEYVQLERIGFFKFAASKPELHLCVRL